jgi:small-conductance mechanosensitive channel
MEKVLDQNVYGNAVREYVITFAIVLVGVFVMKILSRVVRRRLIVGGNIYTRPFLSIERYLFPIVILSIAYISLKWLVLSDTVNQYIRYAFSVSIIFLMPLLVTSALGATIRIYLIKRGKGEEKLKQVQGIILILNFILWAFGLIFLFDNLGFDIAAILTGLGIGGIAIALAAQTIVGDVFNYFVIFFDRPFELGDFIVVDDKMGTVEFVGLKTTRLRSLHGEQIVFSNGNLMNARVHNYKRMNERRVLFRLSLVYETSSEMLKQIPGLICDIIQAQEETRFDRAHFSSIAEYSFTVEVVYYVLSADYNRYMDIQQNINLKIHESFRRNGIQFAPPTYFIRRGSRTR